jgi:RNA polymerase sigma factor (sigma-70 family)
MSQPNGFRDFEQDVLPHLNSAYNLARWLTRNDEDAEDIVQEAYLRAFRFYRHLRGGDARPWLLKIVRNAYYSWLKQYPVRRLIDFDQDMSMPDSYFANPEEAVIQESNSVLLHRALEKLPAQYREVLILRELEGMSYQEIATVVGAPAGTVMSRLSRARLRLHQSMTDSTRSSSRIAQ